MRTEEGVRTRMAGKKQSKSGSASNALAQRSPYKKQSNPASTGGAGVHYEAKVQAKYLWAMLSGSHTPLCTNGRVTHLQFQAKIHGYQTDDLVCETVDSVGQTSKALMQIKRSLAALASDKKFKEAITAAWLDFQDSGKFARKRDRIVLVYDERLSPKVGGARALSSLARTSDDACEFWKKATEADFSSGPNRQALEAVGTIIAGFAAEPPSQDEQYVFWRHLFFVSHSIDDEASDEYATIMDSITWALGKELAREPGFVWAFLVDKCLKFNSFAASVGLDNVCSHLPPEWVPVLENHRESGISYLSAGVQPVGLISGTSSPISSPPGYVRPAADAALAGNRANFLFQFEGMELPIARDSSANKLIARQLDSISGKLKNCQYQTALDDISIVGKDLQPFDNAQKARWYHQRGICHWHLGDAEQAAADFLKAGEFDGNDEKIVSARIRGLALQGNAGGAIEEASAALERFPESLPILLSMLHAKIIQNVPIDPSLIPAIHRDEADVLQMLAWAAKQRGEQKAGIELAIRALDSKSVGFYTRNTALTIMIEGIINSGGSLTHRILDDDTAERLRKVLEAFEPLAEHLWSVQSPSVVADTAAYLGYGFLMLNRAEGALRLVHDANAYNLSCPNLLRVELEALSHLGRKQEYWEKASQYVEKLDDANLISIAQNAANSGRIEMVERIIERARAADPKLLTMLTALRWLALVNSDKQAQAKEEVLGCELEKETDLYLLAIAVRILYEENEKAAAESVLSRVEQLASQKGKAEHVLVADLLYDVRRYKDALRYYEKALPRNQFSDWHVRLLRCYVKTGSRRKAKGLIEGFPAGWLKNDEARFLAVELGQTAGDWLFLEGVAKAELERSPEQASSWILNLYVLVRVKPAVEVHDFLETLPVELKGSIEQLAQLSVQEIRYGLHRNGMQRMYRLHRMHLNNVESASAYFSMCLLNAGLPHMEESLATVVPGTSVELKDKSGRTWRVTIDPAEIEGLSEDSGFLPSSSEYARLLLGTTVGTQLTLPGPLGTQIEAEVVSISSAYLWLMVLARDLATESLSPTANMVSISMETRQDGSLDLSPILAQLQHGNAHAQKTFELYKAHQLTLGVFSRLMRKSPVDTIRSWGPELPPLFVSTGTIEERQMAAEILRNPEQAYVVDAATLTLLVNFDCIAVLGSLPKIWVSSVSNDIIQAELEKLRTESGERGTLFERDGKLGFIEATEESLHSNLQQLEAIAAAIERYCEVAPAYGLEQENEIVNKLQSVLTDEEHSILLLAEEKNACLFTVDGRFRRFASFASISGVWPQATLVHAFSMDALTASAYSAAVLKMFYANHDFISLRADDLMFMARQGKDWVNFGLRQLKKSLSSPQADFRSAYDVCIEFMELLATSGSRLNVFVEILKHLTIGLARHKDSPSSLARVLDSFVQGLLQPDPDAYYYPGAVEYIKQDILRKRGYALAGLRQAFELAEQPGGDDFPRLDVLMCGQQPVLVLDKSQTAELSDVSQAKA
ncbi:tetratricopeptide repeat protein [Castellaniella defragrans]|uniref:Tetratricopeptide (TPR) repeat protein n=1 Tax=Castellaniella defragrans TaxID=75697 RepID=A0A7W9TRX9_CASDE|nr:hypothetical protein [Castellaniella defragrans]KAB0617460.1 hypothetical protein F7Q88_07705 [Castellaniella defragrans]MBB6085451.1 tetratricopeptide (TPR) repeat protein [Castellaniella defragrans]